MMHRDHMTLLAIMHALIVLMHQVQALHLSGFPHVLVTCTRGYAHSCSETVVTVGRGIASIRWSQ